MTQPNDKIIEAVARAICRASEGGHLHGADLDLMVEHHWMDWAEEAKAAIQAYEKVREEG